MYKISFFVPNASAEGVKNALFKAGAGRIGRYDSCCWQSAGTGQFRPLEGSDPAVGAVGELEKVPELKVEMVCADDVVREAVAALRTSHPYEEPAFDVMKLEEF